MRGRGTLAVLTAVPVERSAHVASAVRRRMLASLLAMARGTVVSLASFAQAQKKGWRIGVLSAFSKPKPGAVNRFLQFFDGLRELGYVEGRRFTVQWQLADNEIDRLPALAGELVNARADLIVTLGTPGAQAAQQATRTIPIVVIQFGDPVASGFAKSLARPGGNVTGVTNITLELLRKRLELLLDVLPGARRVAVLGNPGDQNTKYQVSEVQAAAKQLQVELRIFEASSAAELDPALREIAAWKPDALLTLVHPIYRVSFSPRIVTWAPQQRMVVMHAFIEEVEAGGLIAYAADLSDHYERVASYVVRLLKGADPATLPVERPTRVELIVNLKTARGIGMTFPQSILARADRVIE